MRIRIMTATFLVCGFIYYMLEIVFRSGHASDISMFICAGLIGVIASTLNNWFSFEMLLQYQILIGTAFATLLEGVTGEILKALNGGFNPVWDYTKIRFEFIRQFNFFDDQCNLFFCLLWAVLVFIAILIGDSIEYYLYEVDPQPYYKISKRKILFALPRRK